MRNGRTVEAALDQKQSEVDPRTRYVTQASVPQERERLELASAPGRGEGAHKTVCLM